MRDLLVGLAAVVAACGAQPPVGAPAVDGRAAAWDSLAPEQREWVLRNPEAAVRPGGLSEEEAQWVREHPEAARRLGELPADERTWLMERVQELPPAMQERIRRHPEGYLR